MTELDPLRPLCAELALDRTELVIVRGALQALRASGDRSFLPAMLEADLPASFDNLIGQIDACLEWISIMEDE